RRYRDQPLQFRAEIALDLEVAASDGIVRYAGCEGLPFEIKKTWPADGTVHMPVPRPRINIEFSDRVDPALLTDQRIQLRYPNADNAMVQVPSRLMRDDRQLFLIPEAPLLPGV